MSLSDHGYSQAAAPPGLELLCIGQDLAGCTGVAPGPHNSKPLGAKDFRAQGRNLSVITFGNAIAMISDADECW